MAYETLAVSQSTDLTHTPPRLGSMAYLALSLTVTWPEKVIELDVV